MLMPALAAVVGCSGVATASSSPTPSAYAARELPYLQTLNRSNQFSGAALVAVAGHVVLRTAVGSADVQHRIANRPNTRFRIGSITKVFTATVVMMLVQDGRLKLADSPCQYVEPCPDAWKSVTVRNLLTHTSGIPDYLRPITLAQFDAPTPPGDLLALVSDRPLLFQPGSSYAYSNANYVLLGLIIERLSGISYAAFLKRRIFGPLGMGSSGYERDFERVPKHATGYGYKTTTTTESIPTDEAAFSDGGLYSTVDDLLRFDQALYGDRLLPQQVRDEMFTRWGGPGIDAVASVETGLGWNLRKDASGQPVVFHGGQIPGYNATLERHLGHRVTVVVLSNFYWARCDEIASLLASQAAPNQ